MSPITVLAEAPWQSEAILAALNVIQTVALAYLAVQGARVKEDLRRYRNGENN